MKILFRHKEAIPVKNYGGTERILWWLMKDLKKLGHEVFLIGAPASDIKSIGATLIPEDGSKDWRTLIPKGIDILHLFLTPQQELKDYPLIVTIHGNGKPGERFHRNTVFLSKNHAKTHNGECFVYNGIDFSDYPFKPKKEKSWNKFCFLAKAKWSVKNLKDCIRACKTAKKDLYVAGGRAWSFSRYVHSLGFINDEQKLRLLRSTDALLFPVRWNEPFGVAIIEAYSQGLPVLGSCHGSLPELIDKNSGAVCRNYMEFLEAVGRAQNAFDAEQIRAYAESRFSSTDMAKNYLKLYKRAMDGELLNSREPEYTFGQHPETLMEF